MTDTAQCSGSAQTTSNATGDLGVTAAIGLGWQIAELYQEASGPQVEPTQEPAELPGLCTLGWQQLVCLRFDQVSSGLSRLSERITAGGLSVESLVKAAGHASEAVGAVGASTGSAPASLRRAVLDLHIQILDTLTAVDARLGKAYGLGRALADLSLQPTASTREAFQADFSERIDTIKGWLLDLKTVLPDHAGACVGMSLEKWQEWVDETAATNPIWNRKATWTDPLHPASTQSLVTDKLSTQGSRWRAILTGEKQATDFLDPNDFVVAGEALVQRLGGIGRRFWSRHWRGISLGGGAFGALIAVLVRVPGGSGGGLGALGAILGGTGICWKAIQATLGTAARTVEPSLWGAELDLVIAEAITVKPESGDPPAAGHGTLLARIRRVPRVRLDLGKAA